MLKPHRRFLGAFLLAVMTIVMLGAFLPDPLAPPFADPPPAAKSGLLTKVKASLLDVRSRFRETMNYTASMPLLRGIVWYELGSSPNPEVYLGRNGHLFYNAEETAEQSAGAVYREGRIHHFVEMADTMRQLLATRGAKLVVAVPPNAQSVALASLPAGTRTQGPLEYDLALHELAEKGITTADIRSAFRALGNADGLYRRTDTHWTGRGATIAFNLTMAAAGHPEWRLDPEAALAPERIIGGGDLARLMGLQDYLTESFAPLRPDLAPADRWTKLDVFRSPPFFGVFYSWAFEQKEKTQGERLLILGDSFTDRYWQPLLMLSDAARIGWLHHGSCTFDWNDVERFAPTIVVLAPVERALACDEQSWPKGLTRVEARAATP